MRLCPIFDFCNYSKRCNDKEFYNCGIFIKFNKNLDEQIEILLNKKIGNMII